MDANQLFSIANQSPSSWERLAPVAPVATVPPGNTDFADLFNGQMLAQVRQEFAAPVTFQVDLQLVSLGPKINLITADAPLPDIVSVASFARSQGLDEEAIRTLFGSQSLESDENPTLLINQMPTQGSPEAVLQLVGALGLVPGSVAPLPMAAPRTEVLSVTTAPGFARADPQPIDWPVQSSTAGPSVAVLQVAGGSCLLPSSADAISAVQQIVKALPLSIATPPIAAGVHSEGTVPSNAGKINESQQVPDDPIKSVEQLIASLVSIQLATRSQAANGLANGPVTEVAPRSIDDAMQVAMRVQFDMKSQGITRRLAQMSGNSEKASWASVLATASSASLTEAVRGKLREDLNIDILSPLLPYISPDGPEPLLADSNVGVTLASSLSGESVKSVIFDSLRGSISEVGPNTLAEQRSAQYQQLADRVGQALGERLITQMERGEWKLELRLRPESLGRIDVTLAMHAGALDASFASDNSLTRDLILQGVGKLRDTLSQSGTAVANVWVGGGQGSNHDGNPTPGRSFKEATLATRNNDDEAVLSVSSRRSTSNTSDGLDILA